MSGIDEQQTKKVVKVNASKREPSNRELDEWGAFVRGYLSRDLYLGPSKTLIVAELFGGTFILGIVGLLIIRFLVPGFILLFITILSVLMFYWGAEDLGKYLGWRVRRNEWIRRAGKGDWKGTY